MHYAEIPPGLSVKPVLDTADEILLNTPNLEISFY
jgi:hypothetical protein